ncbi:putative acetyltransferase, GNAT [Leifsonia sp. LS1]|uniref:GNAT family N-acetyltransferase n=1 Tax=Leifsonia sp. LS1 TaxID=2828483 RepID=UPI001CFD499C|nr:GNAT family N-acetyltransferase [Leifsonia sp. LS1]GIT79898.1 putative acetyltransferase, GNAT [Leifsonia sp. LS1]
MHQNDEILLPLRERLTAPPDYSPRHPLVARWRPASVDDIDAVWEIAKATDAVEHPNYIATREEVAEELGYSFVDLERDSLLAETADGRVIAAVLVVEPPRKETLVREFLRGGVHPDFAGRGIGRELLAWQLARAEQKLAASDEQLPGWIVGYADERAPRRERLLRAGGLEPVRYFLALERDLSEPIPAVIPSGEVRIVPFAPELSEAAHRARDEAFGDHWGSQPMSDEQWKAFIGGSFRADLSFVALAAGTDGDEVAGVVLSQVNEEDWTAQGFTGAYVAALGTTRAHRGRRIAPALLSATLQACADRGWERVTLDVDAENPTGALGLYTRLGFATTTRETGLVRVY